MTCLERSVWLLTLYWQIFVYRATC